MWQSEFATFCFDPTTSKIVAVGTAILELLYVICLHETKTQGRAFKKSFVKIASIPSKVITTNFLKIFLKNYYDLDDIIFEFNPDLKPEEDFRGINFDISFTGKKYISPKKRDSLSKHYIKTLNTIYKINDVYSSIYDIMSSDILLYMPRHSFIEHNNLFFVMIEMYNTFDFVYSSINTFTPNIVYIGNNMPTFESSIQYIHRSPPGLDTLGMFSSTLDKAYIDRSIIR